ncbi:hypothetical protein ACFX2F_002115 [Malus domestica]
MSFAVSFFRIVSIIDQQWLGTNSSSPSNLLAFDRQLLFSSVHQRDSSLLLQRSQSSLFTKLQYSLERKKFSMSTIKLWDCRLHKAAFSWKNVRMNI